MKTYNEVLQDLFEASSRYSIERDGNVTRVRRNYEYDPGEEDDDKPRSSDQPVKRGRGRPPGKYGAYKKKNESLTLEDLEDFSGEELEHFMQTEDFDRLDELSKKTLGSYIKKASNDAQLAARFQQSSEKDRVYGAQVRKKRNKGIERATDRLTKEDIDLDEVFATINELETEDQVNEYLNTLDDNTLSAIEEAVEQMDEISQQTASNYYVAAMKDRDRQRQGARMHFKPDWEREGHSKMAKKRSAGIKRALKTMDRYEKRFGESLEDFTAEEIEEFMQTEDFEQLDELSKKTLGSYHKKAMTQLAPLGMKELRAKRQLDNRIRSGKSLKDYTPKDTLTPEEKRLATNRRRGGRRAMARLNAIDKVPSSAFDYKGGDKYRKSKGHVAGPESVLHTLKKSTKEGVDLEDFTAEELEHFMQTEDFDQLDEISKKTLGNYLRKASNSAVGAGIATGMKAQRNDVEGAKKEYEVVKKRNKGIKRATDRLTKEDTETPQDPMVSESVNFLNRAKGEQ